MPFELCTAADIYLRLGGQASLVQLLDPEGTGTWSEDMLTVAIRDASNKVAAAAGVPIELSGFTQDQLREKFPDLVTLAAQLAIGLVWTYGSSGRACPDRITALMTEANASLQLLAVRQRKPGAVDYSPTPAQAIRNIDPDPNQTRSLGTVSSWKRGWM